MKRIVHFVLLMLAVILLSSCDSATIQSLGNTVEESRDVSGFDKVSVVGAGRLSLSQTGSESLLVEAGEEIMQYITTEVRGNTLVLEFDPPNNFSFFGDTIHYTLTVDKIVGLEISGSGEIFTETISTEALNMEISGSGEIQVSGTATDQSMQIDGSGEIDGEDLSGNNGMVSIDGSGKVTIWVSGSLDVDISGSGTVNYYGEPSTNLSISGSGKINNRGSK